MNFTEGNTIPKCADLRKTLVRLQRKFENYGVEEYKSPCLECGGTLRGEKIEGALEETVEIKFLGRCTGEITIQDTSTSL